MPSDNAIEIRGLQELQRKMMQVVADISGGELLEGMRDVTLKLQRDTAMNMRDDWHDKGRSMASVTPKVVVTTKEVQGIVGSNVTHVPFGEYGTDPHPIEAKAGKALAFHWERGPKGPGMYFFARVMHPGIKARRMFQRALERNEAWIHRKIEGVIAKVVRK